MVFNYKANVTHFGSYNTISSGFFTPLVHAMSLPANEKSKGGLKLEFKNTNTKNERKKNSKIKPIVLVEIRVFLDPMTSYWSPNPNYEEMKWC